jgi:hypothetical protein
MTFICLKKTSVQAKPGKKNTIMNPSIALMTGKRSRKGKAKPNSSLIGDNQSIPCLPVYQYLTRMIYYYQYPTQTTRQLQVQPGKRIGSGPSVQDNLTPDFQLATTGRQEPAHPIPITANVD